MRRSLPLGVGLLSLPMVALAVGDIPTRYSGSFPSDGIRTNITGTYTGKTLTVRFVRVVNNRTLRRVFSSTCTTTSPTQTRCTGTYQGVGDDQYSAPGVVVVTWSAGQPAAMVFKH